MRPPEKFRTATRFCAADQRYKGRKPEPRAYVQGLDVRTMSGRGRNIFLDILFIERNQVISRFDCWSLSDVTLVITGNYNSAVVIRAKAEPSLRPFKGSGRIRERGSDAWFPIEFLTYHDDRNRLHSFAYVRREDGGEIADGHYVFLDELGERSLRWRKWKGKWQFGWRYRETNQAR